MTLDQRARSAGAAVLDRLDDLPVPDPSIPIRRVARRRRLVAATAGFVVLAAVSVGVAAARHDPRQDPAPPVDDTTTPGWSSIDKATAGLGEGSALNAVASDGEHAVLAGGMPSEGWWRPALWWSDDGRTWHEADLERVPGEVFAVAIDNGVALAIGSVGDRDESIGSSVVWRSEDAGHTWTELVADTGFLGEPAPEMGRPFVDQLVYYRGHWVASGGSSSGYAGIWASTDGIGWTQVFESEDGGTISLTRAGGDLIAYTGQHTWSTDDPTEWGNPSPMFLPADRYPVAMADGAGLAVGQSLQHHEVQELLHGVDPPNRWEPSVAFGRLFPDVFLGATGRFGSLDIVSGADRQNRPDAWVRIIDGPWQQIPPDVRGDPGGILQLLAQVDGQVLALGTAPELNRFFVYAPPPATETTDLQGAPIDPDLEAEEPPVVGEPGSLAWLEVQAGGFGITDFEPDRASLGEVTIGELRPLVPPAILENAGTLDPTAFDVDTIGQIPLTVGVYRAEPGSFTTSGPNGEVALAGDTLLVVETPDGGSLKSIINGETIAGLLDLLEPA